MAQIGVHHLINSTKKRKVNLFSKIFNEQSPSYLFSQIPQKAGNNYITRKCDNNKLHFFIVNNTHMEELVRY